MVTRFKLADEDYLLDGKAMDNKERRIRLRSSDGTSYIRTEMGKIGAWQNAHHHKGISETYIIQKGWIAVVEQKSTSILLNVYKIGKIFTSSIGVDHNVYMSAGSIIHTVKHGIPVGNLKKKGSDWYPASQEFDEETKNTSLLEIMLLHSRQ